MNTMKRLLFAILVAMVCTLSATAQNKIDRMVEQYSAVGNSKFTSAVERNPRTRRVEKIVKVLEVSGDLAKEFYYEFLKELETNGINKLAVKDGKTTVAFTREDQKSNRVYMLKVDGPPILGGLKYAHWPDVKVTIIVRIKK